MGNLAWETKGEMRVGRLFEKKGYKVIYQKKLGPYTLDIFLPQLNVNIEVYGPHHVISSRIKRDNIRTKFIISHGYDQYIIKAQDTYCMGTLKDFTKRIIQENSKKQKNKELQFNNALSIQIEKWQDKGKFICIG